ncbi:MAG: restriction endonuclease [Sediminibacterium sp.]|nr:MAG: restriction endonuclease [Sediminibacterium sp.] [Sediminibacterium sp. FEMGT703S]
MLDFKEIVRPEDWELFARDFLQQLGFFIESSPDRGPDGGKDLLITETIEGKVGQYQFRWLVSCKHNAVSNISVSETEEYNILERVAGFNADGYIGFYSTVASSGLNNRLKQLKEAGKLKDFRIFEHKLIENYLISIGFSTLLMRYFPVGYRTIKPLHVIFDKYYPLECDVCGKDLLESMFDDKMNGIISFVGRPISGNKKFVDDIYIACKGKCDKEKENEFRIKGLTTNNWNDLKDLTNSALFIKYIMATLNQLQSGNYEYTKEAFAKEKVFLLKMSQKVLFQMNEEDKERHKSLAEFGLI